MAVKVLTLMNLVTASDSDGTPQVVIGDGDDVGDTCSGGDSGDSGESWAGAGERHQDDDDDGISGLYFTTFLTKH